MQERTQTFSHKLFMNQLQESVLIDAKIIGMFDPREEIPYPSQAEPSRYDKIEVVIFGNTGLPEKIQSYNISHITDELYEQIKTACDEHRRIKFMVDLQFKSESYGTRKMFFKQKIFGIINNEGDLEI